jgi:UDP-glucose 4-epimerase
MKEPLRYYHNITANVVNVMEAMQVSRTRKVSFALHTYIMFAAHGFAWVTSSRKHLTGVRG